MPDFHVQGLSSSESTCPVFSQNYSLFSLVSVNQKLTHNLSHFWDKMWALHCEFFPFIQNSTWCWEMCTSWAHLSSFLFWGGNLLNIKYLMGVFHTSWCFYDFHHLIWVIYHSSLCCCACLCWCILVYWLALTLLMILNGAKLQEKKRSWAMNTKLCRNILRIKVQESVLDYCISHISPWCLKKIVYLFKTIGRNQESMKKL